MAGQKEPFIKGRGAQLNTPNPYDRNVRDAAPVDWALVADEWETADLPTEIIETHPKTILNKVESADIPSAWSMNPYQGCEHGCVYCYARNSHTFWGYSAGLDFERKILVKRNAAQLLEQTLKKKTWKASPIMFAGNTDVYQPVERKLNITRQCLEVLLRYRHPVSLITKNSLVLRDLDLLTEMARLNLVHVAISITTTDDRLRQFLEPRTSSIARRFRTVETLVKAGVPTFVMAAPIIPGLNDHDIFSIARQSADAGALGIGYTMVRLNGDVAILFEDWLRKTQPDRADRVLNRIRDVHNGELSDFRPGVRMRGEGEIAHIIKEQFRIARERFFAGRTMPKYDLTLHEAAKTPQLSLFGPEMK